MQERPSDDVRVAQPSLNTGRCSWDMHTNKPLKYICCIIHLNSESCCSGSESSVRIKRNEFLSKQGDNSSSPALMKSERVPPTQQMAPEVEALAKYPSSPSSRKGMATVK